MVKDILGKLEIELQQEIISERQVVYILVQIRKLIDTDELAKKFEALKLHCDWVLHTALDRQSAKRLLGTLNNKFRELLNRDGNSKDAMRDLRDQLGLQPFKDEFLKLVQHYGLDESFCTEKWWFDFLSQYSRVILDCPLQCDAESDWSFDKVVLVDVEKEEPDRLDMPWELSIRGELVTTWSADHYSPEE